MAPCLGSSSCPLLNQRHSLNSRPCAGLRNQCQPQCTIRLSKSPSSVPKQVGKSALSLPVTRENIEFVRQRLEQLLYRSSTDQLTSHVLSLSETWQTLPQQIVWESSNLSSPETPGKGNQKGENFHANVGDAIRTLREDIPLLFVNDLNCEFSFPICMPAKQVSSQLLLVLTEWLCNCSFTRHCGIISLQFLVSAQSWKHSTVVR